MCRHRWKEDSFGYRCTKCGKVKSTRKTVSLSRRIFRKVACENAKFEMSAPRKCGCGCIEFEDEEFSIYDEDGCHVLEFVICKRCKLCGKRYMV